LRKRAATGGWAPVILALAASGCAASMTGVTGGAAPGGGAIGPKRRLVHIDHVDPAKASQFEDARRQLLAAYAAQVVHEGTTTLIETKDDDGRPEFLSLRPFGAYAEIDKLNDAAAARAAAIGKELDRLDAMTHATLVPPHASEIWLLRPELSYVPAGGATEADASAARITVAQVAPTSGDEYESAAKEVGAALVKEKSPVTRLAFTSSYGTGDYVTLWLARSAADLEAALALTGVSGAIEKERAKAVKSVTRVAFVRRELSSR
jgi:hypothetical protein